ncbi:VOC family protein [Sphaerisporangium corydalis]|uniref:VOC family protein n=1 Tax=Sphaerisporangium corydalis TaxID=1441875 RepID=A0ABV9EJE6_9ACTN|nr:VOC family protein [Sphaerisporangium corydalis]
MIKLWIASVFVEDQAKALTFYTDVLGFTKLQDIPLGEARWLTVASPSGPEGVQLLLEPNDNPIAKTFQRSLFEAGIPATSLATDDIHVEFKRMTDLGVTFTMEPTEMGPVTHAVFDDTCGNLIGLDQLA